MAQVNVNPGSSGGRGDGGAAMMFGMGMTMIFAIVAVLIVGFVAVWFVVKPMMFSGPPTINVNTPAQQAPAKQAPAQQPAPPAPAKP